MDFDILPHAIALKKCKGELPKEIKNSVKGINLLFSKYTKDPSEKNKATVIKASTKAAEAIDKYVIDQKVAENTANELAKKKQDDDAAASKKKQDDDAIAAKKKEDDDAAAAKKKEEDDAAATKKKADDDAAAAKKKADDDAAAAKKKKEDDDAAAEKERRGEYDNPYTKGYLGR